MPKIVYVVKAGREQRLRTVGPREFFYGFLELSQLGGNMEMVPDRELGFHGRRGAFLVRAADALIYRVCGISSRAVWRLFRNRRRLANADLVFVTTNTLGLGLGLLKRFGLLRAEVLFLAMGLVEQATPARWRHIFRWALSEAHVVALAARDAQMLSELLRTPVPYVPFGVDKRFWTPSGGAGDAYVLSIGNDRHRDYATLLAAWRPEFPTLKIVTRLPLTANQPNVELIRGDWHAQTLSDAEVLNLMRGACFVVLPIDDTVQPSGQSAALQAMACGKAVLVTDYPGLWNRELMVDGQTCVLLGRPGDVDAISRTVARVLTTPDVLARIGLAARRVVDDGLNTEVMSAALRVQMELILGRSLVSDLDPSSTEGSA